MGIAARAVAIEAERILIYTTYQFLILHECCAFLFCLSAVSILLFGSLHSARARELCGLAGASLLVVMAAHQPTSPSLRTSTSPAHPNDTFATIDSTQVLDSRIDESDLDPAAFLKSVRELSEKREREDSERVRRLEEEIEKGRQERAKRRQGG